MKNEGCGKQNDGRREVFEELKGVEIGLVESLPGSSPIDEMARPTWMRKERARGQGAAEAGKSRESYKEQVIGADCHN